MTAIEEIRKMHQAAEDNGIGDEATVLCRALIELADRLDRLEAAHAPTVELRPAIEIKAGPCALCGKPADHHDGYVYITMAGETCYACLKKGPATAKERPT